MRAFVTGGSGFVGTWLERHLTEMGDEVASLAFGIDIADQETVGAKIAEARPDVIYHLAAMAHVGESWESPDATFAVNVMGTLALLEVARKAARPRVILVSSAEVYGGGAGLPIDEHAALSPVSPYAASKIAAEYVGIQEHLGRGLEVIRTRPFNHVGPGQAETFVVSGFARRVIEAERDGSDEIRVGNLDACRDFTDVRDVVRAYRLLAEDGVPGAVYNICSGAAISIATLVEDLLEVADTKIKIVSDPELFRPIDTPVIVGDCTALRRLTGWMPEIPWSQTLKDVLEDWRSRLGAEPKTT